MIRLASEWLTRSALRLVAMGMAFAAIALLAAGLAIGSAVAAQVAVAFLLAGGVSVYVLSARRPLPFETVATATDRVSRERWPVFAGLGLMLIALWVCVRMQPAIALWQHMLATLDGLDVWASMQKRPEMSGPVFAPIAAALAVPAFQAMSATAIVVGSVAAIVLLLVRGSWFGRVLLACTLMQGALVFASVSGTAVAERAVVSVSDAIRETRARDPLIASRALEEVERYRDVTTATTRTLMWTWAACGLLTALVFLVGGISAPANDATRPIAPIDHGTASSAERERYFDDVAQRLSRRSRF